MLRRVEFRGLPSVYADPEIKLRMARGTLTRDQRRQIRKLEADRQRYGFARFYGATIRILGREVELFPDGAYREIVPIQAGLKMKDGKLTAGVADGWTPVKREYGRLDGLPAEKIARLRGKTYVAEKGWDRVYVFGPREFIQMMTEDDVARLMAVEANRRMFVDLEAPLLLFSRDVAQAHVV